MRLSVALVLVFTFILHICFGMDLVPVIRHCSDLFVFIAMCYSVSLPKLIPWVCIHEKRLILVHSFVDFLQVLTMGYCRLASVQCRLRIARGSLGLI